MGKPDINNESSLVGKPVIHNGKEIGIVTKHWFDQDGVHINMKIFPPTLPANSLNTSIRVTGKGVIWDPIITPESNG